MTTRCLVLLLLILVPACSSEGEKNRKLQAQWNIKCKETADLLAGVKDATSAKAAEPKLKTALRELSKIDEQLQTHYDSEDVDPSDRGPMTEEVGKGIAEMQRLTQETLRISQEPELVKALGATWKKIPMVPLIEANRGAFQRPK